MTAKFGTLTHLNKAWRAIVGLCHAFLVYHNLVEFCCITLCLNQRVEIGNCHIVQLSVITGSIARSATRRNLSYSEADFEVFCPTGATRCTDGDEIW